MGGPGPAQRRAADGGAGRDDRDHRDPFGPERAAFLDREPAVDHHRLRAGVRQPPAARWQAQ